MRPKQGDPNQVRVVPIAYLLVGGGLLIGMLDSPVLDAAFGLIFVFYAIALVCAGAVELIATRMKKRSKYLLRGIRDLLADVEFGAMSLTPKALKGEADSERNMYARALGKAAGAGSEPALSVEKVMNHGLVQPSKFVGLLISIGAAALGAPFWYKLLDRVGSLRNAGNRPPSSTQSARA